MKRTNGFLVGSAAVLVLAGTAGAQERVVTLDTVTVNATSHAAKELATSTRAVEVVTADEIRRAPVSSIPDVLQWAFGVDLMARSPALADVGIRGSSFEQVLVLVDGVRVSDAQTGHFHLNLAVPLEQVERIEVLRGAASALFGADALGGVINIVTRDRNESLISARADAGSFGSRGAAAAAAIGGTGLRADFGAEYRRSDGHRPGTDSRVRTARAALRAPLGERALTLDLATAARDFGADGFYGPFPSYEETRTTTAALGLRGSSTARLVVEPRLSARRNADDFILRRTEPEGYRNQHETTQLGAEIISRLSISPLLALAAGGELYHEELESVSLGDREESRSALFLEAAGGRRGAATATVGLRRDWHEAHEAVWSPSAAAAWWPTRAVRVRASAGRSFRSPSWTDRYYSDPANIGDPDLRPERAWSRELGVSAHSGKGAHLSATVFRRDAGDLIDWARPADRPAEPFRTRNVTRARFSGLEVESGHVDLFGLRTVARGSLLSVTSSAEEGYASKYALRPLVESLSLAVERTFAERATVMAQGHRNRRSGESAYLRVDGRLSYRIASARLFLDLRNLTDEAYPDVVGNPAPGRSLHLGLEYR